MIFLHAIIARRLATHRRPRHAFLALIFALLAFVVGQIGITGVLFATAAVDRPAFSIWKYPCVDHIFRRAFARHIFKTVIPASFRRRWRRFFGFWFAKITIHAFFVGDLRSKEIRWRTYRSLGRTFGAIGLIDQPEGIARLRRWRRFLLALEAAVSVGMQTHLRTNFRKGITNTAAGGIPRRSRPFQIAFVFAVDAVIALIAGRIRRQGNGPAANPP